MKQVGKRRPVIRLVAFIVAVLLLATMIPFRQSADVLLPTSFDDNASELAAEELIADSTYLSGNHAQRMQALVGHYLDREGSVEYSELSASIAISHGEYEDALLFTDKSIELCDGSRETLGALYLRKGYLYTLLGKNESAIAWLDKGIAYTPQPEAYLTRAQVKANMGSLSDALADVQIYLDTSEDTVRLLPNLINVYESNGEYAGAAELYTRLIDDPNACRPEYYLGRAYCRTLLGDVEAAEKDCDTYRTLSTEYDSTVDLMLGIGFMRAEQYEKALKYFVAAAESDEAIARQVEYYIVLCAFIGGDHYTACLYGDRAVQRVIDGEDASTAQLTLDRKGLVDVSLAETDVATLCKMTGAAHVQRGDYEQAADSLTACLASQGDTVFAHYLRGTCYLAADRYEEAREDLTQAIADNEEPEKSRYARGICSLQLGDYDAAIEDLDWVMMNGEDAELFEQAAQLVDLALERKSAAAAAQPTEATETTAPETTEGPEA